MCGISDDRYSFDMRLLASVEFEQEVSTKSINYTVNKPYRETYKDSCYYEIGAMTPTDK